MLYVLTSGAYSSYRVDDVYEGPDGINIDALRQQFLPLAKEIKVGAGQGFAGPPRAAAFLEFVIKQAGLTKVVSKELYLGDSHFSWSDSAVECVAYDAEKRYLFSLDKSQP